MVHDNHSYEGSELFTTGKSVDVESIEAFIASIILMHGIDIEVVTTPTFIHEGKQYHIKTYRVGPDYPFEMPLGVKTFFLYQWYLMEPKEIESPMREEDTILRFAVEEMKMIDVFQVQFKEARMIDKDMLLKLNGDNIYHVSPKIGDVFLHFIEEDVSDEKPEPPFTESNISLTLRPVLFRDLDRLQEDYLYVRTSNNLPVLRKKPEVKRCKKCGELVE